jgi:putative membrane protein
VAVVRIIFWLVVAGLYALFATENWVQVPLVFGDTEVLIRLPALILAALLVGFLPTYIAYRVARSRRLRSIAPVAIPVAPVPLPSEAQPIVVPPGCG